MESADGVENAVEARTTSGPEAETETPREVLYAPHILKYLHRRTGRFPEELPVALETETNRKQQTWRKPQMKNQSGGREDDQSGISEDEVECGGLPFVSLNPPSDRPLT